MVRLQGAPDGHPKHDAKHKNNDVHLFDFKNSNSQENKQKMKADAGDKEASINAN